ncbi:MAG TPA: efflux RND transporter periplasmic adaptor subunit [Longimicrobiales bacterium]|nr:efflux RND transporter periplasmic adaptor subunit [Longimicrobiales bacterium]
MNTRKQIGLSLGLVALALAAVALYALGGQDQATSQEAMEGHDHAVAAGADAARPVTLDAEAARRIGVTYAAAVRRPVARTVSTVGNVTYDETRLANVSPKIEGWVERLYVDFTGAPVRRGQPLLAVYSPMLVSAQEELILARRLAAEAEAAGGERATANAEELLESARRRLRYWDIPAEEIDRIEESRAPQKTLVLNSPASGIVVEKNVVQGARIMPGMDLYRIADLSTVWVEGEVFEKDLSLVRLGQMARVSFEAYPGEVFSGRITYVYPTVSVESRTGRIRVELANPDLRLRPGMYAKLELESDADRAALVIPRSAVHFTGERSMVFVRAEDGLLSPREITTGLIAGGDIEVLAGLAEGEVVVSSANFLIDAEANMGSSMATMNGTGGSAPSGEGSSGAANGEDAGHGG